MSDNLINNQAIPNPPFRESANEEEVTMKKGHGRFSNTIIFGVLIFGLTIASMLTPEKGFSESENRVLEGKPKFSLESLFDGTFISKYETYVTDQFVLRDTWIGIKTYTELAMLKKDINGVYFGKDDYLIEKIDNSDIDFEQLAKNEKRLIDFMKKYEALLGQDHVYSMIVPTAYKILSEKLPPYATGFNQGEFLDRLSNTIGDNFIDLRPTLNAHESEYIFYKTDHHWTTLGAYYAYVEWANRIGVTPMSQEEFEIKEVADDFLGTIYSKINIPVSPDTMFIYDSKNNYEVEYNMDGNIKNTLYEVSHLDTKDKYAVYLNGNNPVVKITSEVKNGKTLLIIKDSYGHCFAPFAVNHFETVYMVDLRYLNMPMSRFIDTYKVTDVLVLYNTNGYVKDKNLGNLIK